MKASVIITSVFASMALAAPTNDLEARTGDWTGCLLRCARGCPKAVPLFLACYAACEVACGAIAEPGEPLEIGDLAEGGE